MKWVKLASKQFWRAHRSMLAKPPFMCSFSHKQWWPGAKMITSQILMTTWSRHHKASFQASTMSSIASTPEMSRFAAISSNCKHSCTSRNITGQRRLGRIKDGFWKEGCCNTRSSRLQAGKLAATRQKSPEWNVSFWKAFVRISFLLLYLPHQLLLLKWNSRDKTIELLSGKTVIEHESFASISKICTSLFHQVYA